MKSDCNVKAKVKPEFNVKAEVKVDIPGGVSSTKKPNPKSEEMNFFF